MSNLVDGEGLFSFILPSLQLIYMHTQLSHIAVILQTMLNRQFFARLIVIWHIPSGIMITAITYSNCLCRHI